MKDEKYHDVKITLIDKGPLLIQGPFAIIGSNGKPIKIEGAASAKSVSLCRCGRSENMPFCDGKHAKG